jgi:hypothetical protein
MNGYSDWRIDKSSVNKMQRSLFILHCRCLEIFISYYSRGLSLSILCQQRLSTLPAVAGDVFLGKGDQEGCKAAQARGVNFSG